MDANHGQGYKPPPDFQEEAKEPLIEISSMDSKELWLIQWPNNTELPEFDEQELSLKLHRDGQLGSFEDSSGKVYDVASFTPQESNATVFLPSASGSKIAGNISRLVSLVHYPEPDEIQKLISKRYQKSGGISLTSSSRQFSTPSTILRNSQSTSTRPASTHSSRPRSSLSELGEQSRPSKKGRRAHEPTVSMDRSTQDSGRGHSAVTSSGSSERSHKSKSKKIVKNEE